MTPEQATLLQFIGTIIVGAITSYLVFRHNVSKLRVEEKRYDVQNMGDAADTARTALEIAEKATAAQKNIQEQLDSMRKMIAGLHRLTVDFEMEDLVRDGKASIKCGTIEVVKTPSQKVM